MRGHTSSRLVAVFAVILCVPLVAASGSAANPIMPPNNPGETEITIGLMSVVDSLNPLIGMTDASKLFRSLVYDCLMGVGADLEPVPNLAREWWIVPESDPALQVSGEPYGSVWQYNLTHNASWHDGEPFTAHDVVYTLNLYGQGDNYTVLWLSQPYACFMHFAEFVDTFTVRVHFYDRATGEPKAAAYGGSMFVPILPEHLLRDMTSAYIAFQWNGAFAEKTPPVVGTGPFLVTSDVWEEFVSTDDITLVRNPSCHWKADYGKDVMFPEVRLLYFQDATSLRLALQYAQVDLAQLPSGTYEAVSDGVSSGQVINVETFDSMSPGGEIVYVSANMDPASLNLAGLDSAVRNAMSLATNRSWIVDTVFRGYGEVGSTIIPPVRGSWHYTPSQDELQVFDIAAASTMLEDAGYRYPGPSADIRVATADSLAVIEGWVAEGTPLSFELRYNIRALGHRDIALFLEEQWADVGIELSLTGVDPTIVPMLPYPYELMLSSMSSDPDPVSALFCQSSLAWDGWSDNRYGCEEYDASFNASVSALDPEERRARIHECQRAHYLDAPYIILAYPHQMYAWRNDTYTGWGDWAAEPGRSLDARWGGNPLFVDVLPEDNDDDVRDYFWVYVGLGAGSAVVGAAIIAFLWLGGWRRHKSGAGD